MVNIYSAPDRVLVFCLYFPKNNPPVKFHAFSTMLSECQSVGIGTCIITLPLAQMRAHFLLALVLKGRGKPPQYVRIALRAPIRLQKWRHISANIVLLYFMLPELLVRLMSRKGPSSQHQGCQGLPGSYLALQSQGLISEDKVEFALFPYCEIRDY